MRKPKIEKPADILENKLKEYAEYLIAEYVKINKNAEESGLYFNLKQYSTYGVIKDMLYKGDRASLKIVIFESLREKIVSFAKDLNVDVDIKTFQE